MSLTDQEPESRARRTWRELPPSPPVADEVAPPLVPPAPTTDPTPTVVAPVTPAPAPEPATHAAPSGDGGRRRRGIIIASVAVVAVLALVAVFAATSGDGDATTTPTLPASAEGSPADVAAALGPAVVQIDVLGGLDNGGGVGSGVIVDTSGLVLTAHHVVALSDEVTVRTADDRSLSGRVVGRVPERDLAVVALTDAEDLVAAPLAEPGSVEVGEPAVALGSPFGFSQSVTAGIISGLDRELETPVGTLTGLIQTDAPINPGNSGGPLADAGARVIGINTAIASMSGGNDGVGFAVPVEDYADLLAEVEANGGVDAPTVPAPEDAGGLFGGGLPGLDQLPGLDELLGDLFGIESIPDDLLELLEQLFGEDVLGGLSEDLGLEDLDLGELFGDLFGAGSSDGSGS